MDGIVRCSRYAFGPNRLHYCGPDAAGEIRSYIGDNNSDPGLEMLLKAFRTMFPYLRYIAAENNITDPFDEKVVEAYWIGNELLENIEKKSFYRHLLEDHKIQDKVGKKSFELIAEKIIGGALPHHSFHVIDIWKRTGHLEREHTLESMDSCRISWGRIMEIDGPAITVSYEPLIFEGHKLALGPAISKKIARNLETEIDIDNLKIGDTVSIHWDIPCEVITEKQAGALRGLTMRHIALANQTL